MWKLINLRVWTTYVKKNSILKYLLLSVKISFLVPQTLLIMNSEYVPVWTVKKLYSLEIGSFVWYTEMLKTRTFTYWY